MMAKEVMKRAAVIQRRTVVTKKMLKTIPVFATPRVPREALLRASLVNAKF